MPAKSDIHRHLQNGELGAVYAIASSESILVSEAVAALRGKALIAAPDFNRDEFRVGEAKIERVVEAAGTLPMMAPTRWVHLADLHKLKAKDHGPLMAYLDSPSPSTVLCLSATKIDQRTKLGQKLSKMGALYVLQPPRQREVASWLEMRARAHGYRVRPDAAQLLADLIGGELGALSMALEKLAVYAGEDEAITSEHVEAVVAPTRVHSIFELTDAIGARDLAKASVLLRNALGGGESALMVLAMIARQLRHLLKLKHLEKQGARPGEIAQRLGVRPFLVEPLRRQAQHYEAAEISAALDAAGRADLRLKSTRLRPGAVLDQLLVEIMSAHAA